MKNTVLPYFFFISSLFFISCGPGKSTADETWKEELPWVREYSVQAIMWQQNAAEYRALSYQAFNTAKLRLEMLLQDENLKGKRLAIITDIDETVFDNSPYNAKLVETNKEFSQEEWSHWSSLEEAKEVPGAAEFLNFAADKGFEIFYITNRMESEEEGTLRNMKELNFPFSDSHHLLLQKDTGSKKERFEEVRKDHEVVMYLGDNLSDFTHKFRAPSSDERNNLADELKDRFGVDFIVLPNPMYGDWETKGIYEGKYDWSDREKDSIRKASLKAY